MNYGRHVKCTIINWRIMTGAEKLETIGCHITNVVLTRIFILVFFFMNRTSIFRTGDCDCEVWGEEWHGRNIHLFRHDGRHQCESGLETWVSRCILSPLRTLGCSRKSSTNLSTSLIERQYFHFSFTLSANCEVEWPSCFEEFVA